MVKWLFKSSFNEILQSDIQNMFIYQWKYVIYDNPNIR